jgi:hypothetical protein
MKVVKTIFFVGTMLLSVSLDAARVDESLTPEIDQVFRNKVLNLKCAFDSFLLRLRGEEVKQQIERRNAIVDLLTELYRPMLEYRFSQQNLQDLSRVAHLIQEEHLRICRLRNLARQRVSHLTDLLSSEAERLFRLHSEICGLTRPRSTGGSDVTDMTEGSDDELAELQREANEGLRQYGERSEEVSAIFARGNFVDPSIEAELDSYM